MTTMDPPMTTQERQLGQFFSAHPGKHNFRYTEQAERGLLESLFWSLAGGKSEHMRLLFPEGRLTANLKLREAQGGIDGSEYTEAARGKTCGHVFKPGEASYHCRTCSVDDTCCLCSRCFSSTDHAGHMIRVNISNGGSSCCDCGDAEAWTRPMFCTIHSERPGGHEHTATGGGGGGSAPAPGTQLPADLVANMRMTMGRVFDFMCDVVSCSPEQMRRAKTRESVQQNEELSRLISTYYGRGCEPCDEYTLVLWNDEKHTMDEVRNQVARACRTSMAEGAERAVETDSIGRSLLKFSTDLDSLLEMAKILEKIKVTVTIRSSRDTFREQMCGTMVEWLCDVANCSVGADNKILRLIVCEEMLKEWRQGSPAPHASVGGGGLFDEERLSRGLDDQYRRIMMRGLGPGMVIVGRGTLGLGDDGDDDDDDDDDGDDGNDIIIIRTGDAGATSDDNDEDGDVDDGGAGGGQAGDEGDGEVHDYGNDEEEEEEEAEDTNETHPHEDAMVVDDGNVDAAAAVNADAGQVESGEDATMAESSPRRSGTGQQQQHGGPPLDPRESAIEVPRTMTGGRKGMILASGRTSQAGPHWIERPAAYRPGGSTTVAEDVFRRVRLDWLMLFELRLWKKVRNDLKSLYITTVVQVAEFKRVLSLRFAGLYTALAQLYLVGDREPDHSIVNISLQMLTAPSIAGEVVERGNFLSTLLAILYTFLTSRQVGYPWEVSPSAVLSLDAGTAANRRMYHFYADLEYLLAAPQVQARIRAEERYVLQFLDLVKLHQGISPNKRAVSRHVEWESENWITAQLVTRKFNIKSRQLAEAFRACRRLGREGEAQLARAIRTAAKTTILNSIGADRGRFRMAEVQEGVSFKTVGDFEFDVVDGRGETETTTKNYKVVRFVVEDGHLSFHHGLHYTLSWLLERARHMDAGWLREAMSFTAQQLRSRPRCMGQMMLGWGTRPGSGTGSEDDDQQPQSAEDYLLAAFDYPLRVCAWLAQTRAGMWVRNGVSLRHQAVTYRSVSHRETSYHRDLFLLQTALVVCDPSRVLASVVDRYGMEPWVKGLYEHKAEAQDDGQHLDVAEDMVHLLVVLLTDRAALVPTEEDGRRGDPEQAMRRDVAQVLCLKPLPFQELCNKLPEGYTDQQAFHDVLEAMTTFRPPEGLTDVGTFELRPDCVVDEVDPYSLHYNKTQREETDLAWRRIVAGRTGRPVDEVVFEPRPRPIPEGAFRGLAAFTATGMFAQIVYYNLLYPLVAQRLTPTVATTRIETFLHLVLHLVLLAMAEDKTGETTEKTADDEDETSSSFIEIALTRMARSNFLPDAPQAKTIVALLELLSRHEEFKSCHAKVVLILKRMRQRRPRAFEAAYLRLGLAPDRVATASPAAAADAAAAEEERERKKKAALSRQAQVMAQFQQQQRNFVAMQGADLDWDMDDEGDEDDGGEKGDNSSSSNNNNGNSNSNEHRPPRGGQRRRDNHDDHDDDSSSNNKSGNDSGGTRSAGTKRKAEGGADDEITGLGLKKTPNVSWWRFPSDTCIFCQEATDERRLYGTFALFSESRVLRQTDLQDPDYVLEAARTPANLDRPLDDGLRPFGVAGQTRRGTARVVTNARGETVERETQQLARGFSSRLCRPGPVATSCGHMMHYSCFEVYLDSTRRRHAHQVARHQPENLGRFEFVCPLCKALGNAFVPIIWKGREESYPGALQERQQTNGGVFGGGFGDFVQTQMTADSHYVAGNVRALEPAAESFAAYFRGNTFFGANIRVLRPEQLLQQQQQQQHHHHGLQLQQLLQLQGQHQQQLHPLLQPQLYQLQQIQQMQQLHQQQQQQQQQQHPNVAPHHHHHPSHLFQLHPNHQHLFHPTQPTPLPPPTTTATTGLQAPTTTADNGGGSNSSNSDSASANTNTNTPRHGHGHAAPGQPSAASTGRSPAAPDGGARLRELMRAYQRLRDSLRINCPPSPAGYVTKNAVDPTETPAPADILVSAVGYTISAVEIQQRSVGADYGRTLVSKVPDQVLTQLRILAETAAAHTASSVLRAAAVSTTTGSSSSSGSGSDPGPGPGVGVDADSAVSIQFRRDSERQHCQLFPSLYVGRETGYSRRPTEAYPPLLSLDPFLLLSESLFGVACDLSIDVAHLVRVYYLAELVKVIFHMGRNIPMHIWSDRLVNRTDKDDDGNHDNNPQLVNFAEFAFAITSRAVDVSGSHNEPLNEPGPNLGFQQPGLDSLEGYYDFVRRYALVFLRKCALLMHAKCGVRLDRHVSPNPDADELDRLTEALRVPTIDEMFSALTEHGPTYGWPLQTGRLVRGWIMHHAVWHQTWPDNVTNSHDPNNTSSTNIVLPPRSALISHPGIFELVGLPERYAVLIEEAAARLCSTTGAPLSEPALCLFCGEIVCFQSKCCSADQPPGRPGEDPVKVGGCQRHMQRCQRHVGLFLNIRKCTILFLYHRSGSFHDVPYTDKYGETDLAFRHGRELYLHQKRYDLRLRNVVLSHGIPAFISRKLEAEINNGGWETL